MTPGERNPVSSANVSRKVEAIYPGGISVAVIGPDEVKRSVLAKALYETHWTSVREFNSYPPGRDHLKRLLSMFDVIFIDLDGDPEAALRLVERASANPGARISVYSEKTDTTLALRAMQAGVREYLLLPLKEGALEEVLLRAMNSLRPEACPAEDLMESTMNMGSGDEKLPDVEDSSMAGSSTLAEVVWPAINPIRYGDKLTPAQLNATASVAGTFVYTPGVGFQLPMGTHTLWVTFTPAEPGGSAPLQVANPIVVMKATPVLSWRAPSEIATGMPLDDSHLNAAASVPGRFDYSPAAGYVLPPGTHTISVTFTPADETRFTTAGATISLTVARKKPAIQWKVPNPIEYGTRLSATQLCATTSVPGTFEYNPGLGALLAAGEHPLSVVFTPADSLTYSAAETTVSLRVVKARPSVEWKSPDPVTYGAALGAAQLNATATAPGSLVYSPAAGQILAPGAHEISVTFTPTDALNYTTKSAVVSIVVIEKVSPDIAWPSPAAIAYGSALSASQLNAAASVPGTFVYAPSEGHVLAPGRYSLTAFFTPTEPERFATVQAVTELVVEVSPETDSMSAAAIEKTWVPVLDATLYTLPGPAPARATEGHVAATLKPRQTRVYKGAVYEKGEDDQWHLQKE
jgi:DNA-binding NarL/FixJ family response regulator